MIFLIQFLTGVFCVSSILFKTEKLGRTEQLKIIALTALYAIVLSL